VCVFVRERERDERCNQGRMGRRKLMRDVHVQYSSVHSTCTVHTMATSPVEPANTTRVISTSNCQHQSALFPQLRLLCSISLPSRAQPETEQGAEDTERSEALLYVSESNVAAPAPLHRTSVPCPPGTATRSVLTPREHQQQQQQQPTAASQRDSEEHKQIE
jgi:hypothetical protein